MAQRAKMAWPPLGKLSQSEFLSRYWQKKPVLLKGVLQPFPDLITPEELAGMSCDKDIESRLIIQGAGKNNWNICDLQETAEKEVDDPC
jgi:50S ribosomal protein L16 3-hydroxylase